MSSRAGVRTYVDPNLPLDYRMMYTIKDYPCEDAGFMVWENDPEIIDPSEYLEDYASNFNTERRREIADRWDEAGWHVGLGTNTGGSLLSMQGLALLALTLAGRTSGLVVLETTGALGIPRGGYWADELEALVFPGDPVPPGSCPPGLRGDDGDNEVT